MKKLVLGSVFYFVAAATAFGAGYYEQKVADCSPAAMQREMDAATARTGAGITVVKCNAAPAKPRPVQHVRYVDYSDSCCDCF